MRPFEIGDRVILVGYDWGVKHGIDNNVYSCFDHPFWKEYKVKGTIVDISAIRVDEFPLVVEWDNGSIDACYNEKELRLYNKWYKITI